MISNNVIMIVNAGFKVHKNLQPTLESHQGGVTLHEVLFSDGSTLSLPDCKSAFLVDNRLSSGLMIASFQMEMAILTPLPGFSYYSTNCSLQGSKGEKKILAEYLFFIRQTDM